MNQVFVNIAWSAQKYDTLAKYLHMNPLDKEARDREAGAYLELIRACEQVLAFHHKDGQRH